MSENNGLDDVLQHMTELTELVKGRGQDVTLDWDNLVEQFGDQINTLVDGRAKALIDDLPVYRTAGDRILPGLTGSVVGKNNRYGKALQSFEVNQQARWGVAKLKPVDLWFAKTMLDAQVAHYHAGQAGGKAIAPSDDLLEAVKALTSTGSGTGDELVPTDMAGQLWDDIFLQSKIVDDMIVIDMPTNPFDVPLGLGAVTWRKGTENTATTASDPATAKSILTVTELVTEQNWSYTLDEDAVVAMAPAVRERLAQSGAEIIDDFALNADATNAATGNINLDDADPADDTFYLSDGQDGIRHQWLIDNTSQSINAGGDALVDADIVDMLAQMGKYAIDPNQVRIVTDAKTYLSGFLELTNVMTLDKFGPAAVLLTGQLAAYRGVPIIVSASAPLTEADGKVSTTGANNTLGQVNAYNRMMWYAGFRRDLMIETDRDIQKRMYLMVTSLREAIAAHGTRSSNTHTAGVRNILV